MINLSTAMRDVVDERERQKTSEGWTPEHDDAHTDGELAFAASRYAEHASRSDKTRRAREKRGTLPLHWPWGERWWKPKDRRRDLVRAAALIVAEIERLDRVAAPLPAPEEKIDQVTIDAGLTAEFENDLRDMTDEQIAKAIRDAQAVLEEHEPWLEALCVRQRQRAAAKVDAS